MQYPDPQRYFQEHGPLSNPGRHKRDIGSIPGSSRVICKIVQGLLMHDGALSLYGLEEADFACFSRQTLSVEARLDQFLDKKGNLDLAGRVPEHRKIGTCRDYALLVTGLLRTLGMAARVRCGFAAYLSPGQYDDHWICETWCAKTQRWRHLDAQLDERHLEHHRITFDPSDLPDGQFLTAGCAWRAMRRGAHEAALFGAGQAARGPWFMAVNLARDYLALCKHETSDWDSWREVPDALRQTSDDLLAWGDQLAAVSQDLAAAGAGIRPDDLPGQPFWWEDLD